MEEKSMVAALAWVSKGFPKQVPIEHEPDEDEKANVVKMAEEEKVHSNVAVPPATKKADIPAEIDEEEDSSGNEDHDPKDPLKKFNLENYDKEEAMPVFSHEIGTLSGDKPEKIEGDNLPMGFDDSEEEKEDYTIRNTDAMIVAATIEGEFSNLEVYIFEDKTSTLYVHHDIMLSSFPLCLEWLPYTPGTLAAGGHKGNYIIVGTFLPEIEIWNLDELNALEPAYKLGGSVTKKKPGLKSKGKAEFLPGSHTDAVMCLSLNSARNYILASGSADTTVKVWDLNTQKCLHTMSHHKGKVQSVKWHPTEEAIMISGGYDKKVFLNDVRDNKVSLSRDTAADVETLVWHPHDSNLISVALEDGRVETHDVRSFGGTPLCNFQAHDKAVSGISFSPAIKNLCVTASPDAKIKVWDFGTIENQAPKFIVERVPQMGELFCCNFYRDLPWFIAAGGSKGELYVWDLEENPTIVEAFSGRVEKSAEPMETPIQEAMELPAPIPSDKKKKKKKKQKILKEDPK